MLLRDRAMLSMLLRRVGSTRHVMYKRLFSSEAGPPVAHWRVWERQRQLVDERIKQQKDTLRRLQAAENRLQQRNKNLKNQGKRYMPSAYLDEMDQDGGAGDSGVEQEKKGAAVVATEADIAAALQAWTGSTMIGNVNDTTETHEMSEIAPLSVVPEEEQRYLRVAVVGTPNAGKSTLVNRMCHTKVGAVSNQRNTTREGVCGILTVAETQAVFVDTPGINDHGKEAVKYRSLSNQAWEELGAADVGVVVVDASKRVRLQEREVLLQCESFRAHRAETSPFPLYLVLSKVDIGSAKRKEHRDKLQEMLNTWCHFDGTFNVSAYSGANVLPLKEQLLQHARLHKWEFPPHKRTNRSDREQVAEIIREKCFQRLNKELPYELKHSTDPWHVNEHTNHVIITHRVSTKNSRVKAIVIGHKGECIEWIRERAEEEIGDFLQRSVKLLMVVE